MFGRGAAHAAVFIVAMSAASSVFAAPVNLVVNGDFSAGISGFSTGYGYAATPCDFDPVNCAGEYTIGTSPNGWYNAFVMTGDHTTGTGNMFLANGKDTPDVVWQSTVNGLDPNTDYFFESWLMNICCLSQALPGPQLEFYANGVLLGVGATNTPGVWAGVSTPWNSGALSSVMLELRNASNVVNGNDFALDDVYLGKESEVNTAPMPEPTSIFLLGTGFLAVARRVRKSRESC